MSSTGYQPEQDEVLVRVLARGGYGPDDFDRVLAANCQDPAMLRDFLAGFLDLADPEERRLAFRFMLTALLVRQGAVDPPDPAWPLALLMVAYTSPEPERAADGRPVDDLTPALPVLRARTVLTCAPPARVPCPAGMTG